MRSLSQRLVRLALLALAASLFSYAGPASAQLPVFVPEPVPPSEPESPAPAAEVAPAAADGAPAALPEAPEAPAGAVPADTLSGPAAAKADVITERKPTTATREEEPDVDDGVDEAAERRRWYGWQTLVTDSVSLTALVVGASIEGESTRGPDSASTSLLWLGFLGYEAAPAVVHAAHRNPGRAFASMGVRLGMPLAGAFLGASLASGCNSNLCEAGGAGIGVLLGMAGAIAIDAAVFSYDDAKRAPTRRAGLRPLFAWTPHTAWIGLGGQL
ncbi:MAG TPA: hypothetical protein VHP33_36025 [Polyangiaceae bacterium]|nr:hypothetical protein [Polyangiaceae bacterium]